MLQGADQGILLFSRPCIGDNWTSERICHASSNYKELSNLVQMLQYGAMSKELHETEVFIITDNSTSESVYYRGTSRSKRLFNLALTLRQLKMQHPMCTHFIYVPSKQMIQQGTDGLSRGNLNEGLLQGGTMLDHVLLHLGALDRQPSLLEWIQD